MFVMVIVSDLKPSVDLCLLAYFSINYINAIHKDIGIIPYERGKKKWSYLQSSVKLD